VNVKAGYAGNVTGEFVGFENPYNSYSKIVICDVDASSTWRPTEVSETTPGMLGVVEALKSRTVPVGSAAAAGSTKVEVAPPTDGTAIDCALFAESGCVVETLAGCSVGTAAGPVTGAVMPTGMGAVEPPLHAASIAPLAMASAATDTQRRAVTEIFKQNLKKEALIARTEHDSAWYVVMMSVVRNEKLSGLSFPLWG
jgi:hypothetical protein